MTSLAVLTVRDGSVATISLNRPQAGNAITLDVARQLLEAVLQLDADDAVRCVVVTGSGRFFCVGGDIEFFRDANDRLNAALSELAGTLHLALSRLARMNKPLLIGVNGPAAGAGLSMALMGDVVLAARSSHFTCAYSAIGLTPDGGMSWWLPRLVGLRRAQEMIVTNRRVAADEAQDWGLITRAVDDAEFAAQLAETAHTLAAGASRALGGARQLLLGSFAAGLETQLELEARSIAEAGMAAEAREGIAAFLGKRVPKFNQS